MYNRIRQISLLQNVVPKIGLEVHAQLNINAKIFSQGGNSSQAPPNSQLDLLDIALPGSLPKLNQNALRAGMLSALGLNCSIQDLIHFDRKNYFYTDMPAGFQITQYNKPLAKNGFIDFIVKTHHKSIIAHTQNYDLMKYLYSVENRKSVVEFEPYIKRSHIKQIQLEQDSAKTLHRVDPISQQELYTLIDYNRSGTGLIEIVFEPDLANHHEASSLIKELIVILKALETCGCQLQEGSLRVDANISIESIEGQDIESSNRVELKNLNSLKSLNKGILAEIHRQVGLIKAGRSVIQETRTYETRSSKTIPLRLKEDTLDYRYVPEPNLPPLRVDQDLVSKLAKELPSNLSCNVRKDLIDEFNMDLLLITEVMEEPGLSAYIKEIMCHKTSYDANVMADFLIYTLSNLKNIAGSQIQVDLSVNSDFLKLLSPEKIQTLFDMLLEDQISFSTAYDVIKHIFTDADQSDPKKIVNDRGWYQINDKSKVDDLVAELIKNMKSVPTKYAKKGEKRHLRIMLEKLCEKTGNKINIKRAIKSLDRQLRPTIDNVTN